MFQRRFSKNMRRCCPGPNWQFGKGCGYNYSNSSGTTAIWSLPLARSRLTSDPDDNIFVECADAARADFLITGNRKHFPAFWKNTKIVTPREFVSLVAPHLIP